jgi:hypothetical protein
MNLILRGIVVSYVALSFCLPEVANSAENDLSLLLKPVQSPIFKGTSPSFYLKITNISTHSVRLLNTEKRISLEHSYYSVVVTKNGKRVDVPVAISDPGPISDSDWIEIPSGDTKTVLLSKFREQYQYLKPGVYKAYVKFGRDPYQKNDTTYQSLPTEFVIVK